MGRGRAKAKQQKVARDLKYNTHFTDLDALRRELSDSPASSDSPPQTTRDDDEEEDGWASATR